MFVTQPLGGDKKLCFWFYLMRRFLPGSVRCSVHCRGCYFMFMNWEGTSERGCRGTNASSACFQFVLVFPLWWLPGLFIPWVTKHLIFSSEQTLFWFLTCMYKEILFGELPLPVKVANKVFVPKQALSVLDEKYNIWISSTEKLNSAKGKIFTQTVCHKMWVITRSEVTNCCQMSAGWCLYDCLGQCTFNY